MWLPNLPNADHAGLDRRKFIAYSMAPENPSNGGKWKAWGEVGYDVHKAREQAADDVIRQIERQLPHTPARAGRRSEYGQRFETEYLIVGPNGRRGTVFAVWQIDRGSRIPRLVTNLLKVHKEGR